MNHIKNIYIILVLLLVSTVSCKKDDQLPAEALSPRATFTVSAKEIKEGDEVTFSDNSTNTPTSWQWEFAGGTPSSSTEQNPKVVYETKGIYNVVLTITNNYGTDEVTYEKYITVASGEIQPQVALDFENNLNNDGAITIPATSLGNASFGTRTDNGGSYIFNGNDNPLIIDGYKGINGKEARTMAVWIKPEATAYDSGIMNWGVSATGSRWSFKYRPGNGGIRIEWQGGGMNSIGAGLNDGNWHHVVVTYDGVETVTIYIDGVKDNSKNSGIINTGNAGKTNVEIGSYRENFYYKGEMDNVRIYDVSLTEEEIKELFKK